MEKYIAESYDCRSLSELIQNADDAGAKRFCVRFGLDYVLIANDGRPFTDTDLESLCRSAHSNKDRKSSIGHRGIGFKSITSFAQRVHLISGEFRVTFSRLRTKQDLPEATQVPLVRIPHALTEDESVPFSSDLEILVSEKYSTIFVFGDLERAVIERELSDISPSMLLFLRNLNSVSLSHFNQNSWSIHQDREFLRNGEYAIQLRSETVPENWYLVEQDGISLAFRLHKRRAVKLSSEEAVVHVFLPAEEPTGFGFKLNGDFSTDPSRRRILDDVHMHRELELAANLIVGELKRILIDLSPEDTRPDLLPALITHIDPRHATFRKRSFAAALFEAIKRCADDEFASFVLCPPWLNKDDFRNLTGVAGLQAVPTEASKPEEGLGLFRMLGCQELLFDTAALATRSSEPSARGSVELVARAISLRNTRQLNAKQIDKSWKIWPSSVKVLSLEDLERTRTRLDSTFVTLVEELSGGTIGIERLIGEITSPQVAVEVLPKSSRPIEPTQPEVHTARNGLASAISSCYTSGTNSTRPPRLKKWRTAELLLKDALNAGGCQLEDVSLQNLGYDLEGTDPTTRKVYIEVKSVEKPGESFRVPR